MSTLDLIVRSEFGNRRRYLPPDEMGRAVQTLTGQKTLSVAQEVALKALGVEVREVVDGGNLSLRT